MILPFVVCGIVVLVFRNAAGTESAEAYSAAGSGLMERYSSSRSCQKILYNEQIEIASILFAVIGRSAG